MLTPRKDAFFFQFYRKFGAAKSSYVHFQLRNLLWATSSHDVVLVRDNCVLHWNTLTRQSRLVLDCAGRGADSPLTTHSPFQVSTTHVFGDLLAAGMHPRSLAPRALRFLYPHCMPYCTG